MELHVDLTAKERALLRRTRNQVKYVLVLRRRARCLPLNGGYRSPQLTGMPKGGGMPCGLDGSRERNEAELKELEDAEAALAELQGQALRVIDRLDWKLNVFARLYYLDGMDVPEIAERLEITQSSCWRRLRLLSASQNATKRK